MFEDLESETSEFGVMHVREVSHSVLALLDDNHVGQVRLLLLLDLLRTTQFNNRSYLHCFNESSHFIVVTARVRRTTIREAEQQVLGDRRVLVPA